MFKKAYKYILYYLNLVIPVYSKDFIYEYDFQTEKIKKIENLNLRKYEMQYYNDFNDKYLISRFSKYLIEKEIGLLYYSFKNQECDKKIKLNREYNTIRMMEDKIFGIFNGKIYNVITDEFILDINSDELDFFQVNHQNYVLIKDKIYAIMDNDITQKQFIATINLPYIKNRRDYSITFFNNQYYLICREGENEAFETRLVLYISHDLKNWTLEKILLDSQKLKHLGIDGLGFPSIRVINGNLKMFFSAFWGKHILRNQTVKHWSKI